MLCVASCVGQLFQIARFKTVDVDFHFVDVNKYREWLARRAGVGEVFAFGVNLVTQANADMDLVALQDALLAPDFDAEKRASEIIQSGAAATESHRAELEKAEAEVDANLQEQVRY